MRSAPYRATRRDDFAIWLANRVLRLLATRRCVELLQEVFERGLRPEKAPAPEVGFGLTGGSTSETIKPPADSAPSPLDGPDVERISADGAP